MVKRFEDKMIVDLLRIFVDDWQKLDGDARERIDSEALGYIQYSRLIPDDMRTHYIRLYNLMKVEDDVQG
jgi:hypothetical protein